MSRLENKDMETHDYVQWSLKGVLLFVHACVHESGQLLGLLWNKDVFIGNLLSSSESIKRKGKFRWAEKDEKN